MDIFTHIRSKCQKTGAQLIAVSKTHGHKRIMEVYAQGQRIFGENRVQELVPKYEALPKDIEWHLIGTLQTNKVKYIMPFVAMVHSVDSEKLLIEINKQAEKHHRIIPVLLQFHIAQEETKHGFVMDEAEAMLQNLPLSSMPNIRISGVMGMATFTDDKAQVRSEFRTLKQIFNQLKQQFFATDAHFKEISMGMSADWELALEEGSTLVRIGSLVFGER
jgi:pyridoxal phosphate enzyme (YggS family)